MLSRQKVIYRRCPSVFPFHQPNWWELTSVISRCGGNHGFQEHDQTPLNVSAATGEQYGCSLNYLTLVIRLSTRQNRVQLSVLWLLSPTRVTINDRRERLRRRWRRHKKEREPREPRGNEFSPSVRSNYYYSRSCKNVALS